MAVGAQGGRAGDGGVAGEVSVGMWAAWGG